MKHSRNTILDEKSRQTTWAVALLATVVFQFTACTVGPKYHVPVIQAPPAYKELGDWKTAQPIDQNLGGSWWTISQIAHSQKSKNPR